MHPSIEKANRHLAACMEEDDFPVHNCHATCDDLAHLLAHVANLETTLDKQAGELRDLQGLLDEYKRTLNEIATSYYHDAHAIKARETIGCT